MSSLLLIFSLLLHLVAFYIIFNMYNQLQQLKASDVNEITEILDHYLQDIKRENELLKNEWKLNNDKEENNSFTGMKSRKNEKSVIEDSNELESISEMIQNIDAINDYMETSLDARVLQLHKKGIPINDIAKQLQCGKTEAELIIKFYEEKMSR